MDQATDVFWNSGYEATSLDDISHATRMNRPSLYNAFGDKRSMYLAALDQYREMGRNAMRDALACAPFEEALRCVYRRAISIYLSGKEGPRGCFLIGTAAVEAVRDQTIRKQLADGLHELDDLMEERIRVALAEGELRTSTAPSDLARLACGIMNALALRARAGDSKALLQATAEAGINLICRR